MSGELRDIFLRLVRLGIGKGEVFPFPEAVDWDAVKALADEQGLTAIVLDGLDVARQQGTVGQMPEKRFMKQWVGEVLLFEDNYEQYRRVIAELARFYNGGGVKMMVLKGYACSLDWPRPNHRPCGDIDIWQFGRQKEADAALLKKGVKIDTSHHHHTVFYRHEFMVENHYDFINVHHHKSHRSLEKVLKQLGKDDSYSVEVGGEKVYLPSPNLHALFLLKHLILHFASGEITLRQVLDWAFFVEKHGAEVDWEWYLKTLDEYHMRGFFDIINAICVEELGFAASVFPAGQPDPALKARVLADIISPENGGEMPNGLFARVIWKFPRWRANEWKHRLCYSESMWSAFWSGVWGHLLKPGSI